MKISRFNSDIMKERQLAVSREMDRRGISRKMIAYDAGIKYTAIVTYFPATDRTPCELPSGALIALGRAESMPDDLINMLLDDGIAFVRVPLGIDYDDISQACRDFIDAKDEFHHPESEAGRDLGPTEQATLGEKVVRLVA
jgi:hypothetical protein